MLESCWIGKCSIWDIPIETVIEYVQNEFQKHPELQEQCPTILQELLDLKAAPDYESVEGYSRFIRDYFSGSEDKAEKSSPSPDVPTSKPWWEFW